MREWVAGVLLPCGPEDAGRWFESAGIVRDGDGCRCMGSPYTVHMSLVLPNSSLASAVCEDSGLSPEQSGTIRGHGCVALLKTRPSPDAVPTLRKLVDTFFLGGALGIWNDSCGMSLLPESWPLHESETLDGMLHFVMVHKELVALGMASFALPDLRTLVDEGVDPDAAAALILAMADGMAFDDAEPEVGESVQLDSGLQLSCLGKGPAVLGPGEAHHNPAGALRFRVRARC